MVFSADGGEGTKFEVTPLGQNMFCPTGKKPHSFIQKLLLDNSASFT